jgi:hypothetical protein
VIRASEVPEHLPGAKFTTLSDKPMLESREVMAVYHRNRTKDVHPIPDINRTAQAPSGLCPRLCMTHPRRTARLSGCFTNGPLARQERRRSGDPLSNIDSLEAHARARAELLRHPVVMGGRALSGHARYLMLSPFSLVSRLGRPMRPTRRWLQDLK